MVRGDALERRAVSTGETRGSDVEILAGVQPDMLVVINGPDTLRDGQAVQIEK